MDHQNLGKKIRFLLHTHSKTIQALAEELGVTRDSLREIVDEEAVPTPHLLHRICGVFHVKEDYFGEAVQPRPSEQSGKRPLGISDKTAIGEKTMIAIARRQPRRKLDLMELAARHQALVDCLVAKKVIVLRDYQKRLDALRSKVDQRRQER